MTPTEQVALMRNAGIVSATWGCTPNGEVYIVQATLAPVVAPPTQQPTGNRPALDLAERIKARREQLEAAKAEQHRVMFAASRVRPKLPGEITPKPDDVPRAVRDREEAKRVASRPKRKR